MVSISMPSKQTHRMILTNRRVRWIVNIQTIRRLARLGASCTSYTQCKHSPYPKQCQSMSEPRLTRHPTITLQLPAPTRITTQHFTPPLPLGRAPRSMFRRWSTLGVIGVVEQWIFGHCVQQVSSRSPVSWTWRVSGSDMSWQRRSTAAGGAGERVVRSYDIEQIGRTAGIGRSVIPQCYQGMWLA